VVFGAKATWNSCKEKGGYLGMYKRDQAFFFSRIFFSSNLVLLQQPYASIGEFGMHTRAQAMFLFCQYAAPFVSI
jgi:hypothetical protein